MSKRIFKCVLRMAVFLFVLLSTSSANANNEEVAWDKLQGLGQVESFAITNPSKTKNTFPYHIFVRLPEEYKKSDKQTFPVLYLLDGGTNFPLMVGMYTHLRWMKDIPPMIIVGISYGTHDWRQGNDRSHDFTAPSKEREHWGGAAVFEEFVEHRLMPIIQQKYLVDKDKQVLFGQSLAGQFALYSSMYGKAPFYGVIASNPALYRNLDYFKRPLSARTHRPKVFVSIAEFDDQKYKIPSTEWVGFWQKQQPDWQANFVTLAGQNHLSATPDTIRNGLIWLFKE
ncbi:alpha/beta hydrolase [Paraglaciecola sp. L3A3]|uniref:alpha/beta hydrolase n=1 Tax=Paraglaciecola sp. L3A3 TaxID=2686358 RepID=UPI00131DBA4C|nr:alpha/beta hydrolase-fold protein [Paraglaciecola sp. L3A3]